MTKNEKNGARAYIYTRVSTVMQVDGFSLEAQKRRIEEYATYQHMKVVGMYSDEGTSGKNIEGRPQFQQMLEDIKSGKDGVKFVLVFKLSRFGRNAADTLSSLQLMQDYGVNLICVEDNIDSSADSGKLMISVMSAMAEIERENILAQTMAGRKQKALNGGWNGGFAPYGYKLDNGQLVIAEDEAETVRYIFELYTSYPLGANGVAKRLNAEGIKKKVRQNGKLDTFTGHFIKLVLDNPVYMGKIAFGRRKTEKVTGKRNVYHIVKETDMENIIISDGDHEAIVSEEVWNDAHDKRLRTGFKKEKKEQEHEYVLSGIVLCPGCGKPMYGVASRKKRKDGTPYPPSYAYICRQKGHSTGHECSFHKQFNCREIDDEVANAISFCFVTPEIVDQVYALISREFDTSELQQKLDGHRAREKELKAKQEKYETEQSNLSPFDRNYDRKFSNYDNQLEEIYDQLDEVEKLIQEVEGMIENTTATQKSRENTVRLLMEYGQRYRYLSLAEQKKMANLLIESIEVFPTKRAMGYLKTIHFSVPVVSGGEIKKTMTIWDEYPDILDEEGNFNGYNPEDDLPPSGGFEADEDGNVAVQDENAFLPKKITDETVALLSRKIEVI